MPSLAPAAARPERKKITMPPEMTGTRVRPDGVGATEGVEVHEADRWALGVTSEFSDKDAEVLRQAYLVAGGAHSSCVECFLGAREPSCTGRSA